jgi:ankyrin repeat protein
VQYLVETAKVNVEAATTDGETALDIAIEHDHPRVAAFLENSPFSHIRSILIQRETVHGRLNMMEQMVQPAAKEAIRTALGNSVACLSPVDAKMHLNRAVQIMSQYENSERLVLLGLAFWEVQQGLHSNAVTAAVKSFLE